MVPEEITPLVPAVVGEKVADDQTCYILETLLKYMVIQVRTRYFRKTEPSNVQRFTELLSRLYLLVLVRFTSVGVTEIIKSTLETLCNLGPYEDE